MGSTRGSPSLREDTPCLAGRVDSAMRKIGGAVYTSPFQIGDHVYLNEDTSLRLRVTGLLWRENVMQAELTWVHNGDIKSCWVPAFLAQHVDGP